LILKEALEYYKLVLINYSMHDGICIAIK